MRKFLLTIVCFCSFTSLAHAVDPGNIKEFGQELGYALKCAERYAANNQKLFNLFSQQGYEYSISWKKWAAANNNEISDAAYNQVFNTAMNQGLMDYMKEKGKRCGQKIDTVILHYEAVGVNPKGYKAIRKNFKY